MRAVKFIKLYEEIYQEAEDASTAGTAENDKVSYATLLWPIFLCGPIGQLVSLILEKYTYSKESRIMWAMPGLFLFFGTAGIDAFFPGTEQQEKNFEDGPLRLILVLSWTLSVLTTFLLVYAHNNKWAKRFDAKKKNLLIYFILSFYFHFVGLFFANRRWGLRSAVFFLVWIGVPVIVQLKLGSIPLETWHNHPNQILPKNIAVIWLLVGFLIMWPANLICTWICVQRHNNNLLLEKNPLQKVDEN